MSQVTPEQKNEFQKEARGSEPATSDVEERPRATCGDFLRSKAHRALSHLQCSIDCFMGGCCTCDSNLILPVQQSSVEAPTRNFLRAFEPATEHIVCQKSLISSFQVMNLARLRHPRLVSFIGAGPFSPVPGVWESMLEGLSLWCSWHVQMGRKGQWIRI